MPLELSAKYNIDIKYFQVDLFDIQSTQEIYDTIKDHGWHVSHLVNNAGFGDYGSFLETSLEKELNMINLNISSLMMLTKLFAKDMAARKSGRIELKEKNATLFYFGILCLLLSLAF
ncbi:MAG: SDR family NAD(P)-dependent oxidoreductase [Mongoliibacter sp.]|uniref:SDR family NAD(P)-dependent oxidoreductase n=1 Tax=Mongoliibacter sp. TaxID=2022438 RepID=UPI0012F0C436|nr:SDR family NAD(P)-dependent oxidoreductase [Mongoliibacter sp.]TVP47368.1 MAG: SDR family NAD(P)-dependent oxidoreductase [Mongoliibacter sp.]